LLLLPLLLQPDATAFEECRADNHKRIHRLFLFLSSLERLKIYIYIYFLNSRLPLLLVLVIICYGKKNFCRVTRPRAVTFRTYFAQIFVKCDLSQPIWRKCFCLFLFSGE
jgi:hypothetical protein